ncbi:MAG: iron-containing alcohol dehydrogenase family protein [Streptosporangiaceae bacterium]
MLAAPLVIDVRPGAIAGLGALLSDRRIATQGQIAIAVGPGQGDALAAELSGTAEVFHLDGGSYDGAVELGRKLRAGGYEVVAGIGGGKTIDVTKYAAHMAGIPMVSVPTSLAHDGIASPVSTLRHESGTGSYGVVLSPVAVVVDLDRVRGAPGPLSVAGVGDVVSNLSAVADWELSAADTGEPVDGLAAAMARSAAHALLHQPGPSDSDGFLTVLAEALILSGVAMAMAGSSRPSSGGDHEIMHAINQLYPGTASHGELAGMGALFCAYLRDDAEQFAAISSCLRRHGLPRGPGQVGLSDEQFAAAVLHAPSTRPGRYTILERLALSPAEVTKKVEEYGRAIAG